MKAVDLFEHAINCWRNAKGIGTILIPFPFNDKLMVLGVLQRFYTRSPTKHCVIITSTFSERKDIISFLTEQIDKDENEEFKRLIDDNIISIYTSDYVNLNDIKSSLDLFILYRPISIPILYERYLKESKFKLVILNSLIKNSKDMTILHKNVPMLDCFKEKDIEIVKRSTPVEEYRIGIDIPNDNEDRKLLDYYDEYISTSLSIFGSLDIINQAIFGNNSLSISSTQICAQIATENGWNEHLDMSIDFNIEIDRLYNPSNLRERASMTYEIFRNRNQLLSDYDGKLSEIDNIIQNNRDKKILIINKRGEFASKVTNYVNNSSNSVICLNYHDKVEPIPAVDINGNLIVYKSGVKKGQSKLMGVEAQKTYAETKFNLGDINVLSTNNSPDKKLNIAVDIIIITSPMCEELQSYLYRLSHVSFSNDQIVLYSLYCRNTVEQKRIENKTLMKYHNVKNSIEDETISDFVVVD